MQPGLILARRYELIELLGEGGMGSVWRANQLAFGREVALKVMSPRLAESQEGVARFKREALAVASLASEHVVQVFDFEVDEVTGSPFLVMELLHGRTLESEIERRDKLSPKETLRVLEHVGRAMSAAHAHRHKIVHRDLKPSNIFLVEREDEPLIKVLDFGIAKMQDVSSIDLATRTGAVIGTLFYMSPEQIRGGQVDHRSDLWAMAVIAFECITGVRPFRGNTQGEVTMRVCAEPVEPPSRWGTVPAGFDEWFKKGVERDRELRFQSAKEMLSALQRVVTDSTRQHSAQVDHRARAASGVIGAVIRARTVSLAPTSALVNDNLNGPLADDPREASDTNGPTTKAAPRESTLPNRTKVGASISAILLGTILAISAFWRAPKDATPEPMSSESAASLGDGEPRSADGIVVRAATPASASATTTPPLSASTQPSAAPTVESPALALSAGGKPRAQVNAPLPSATKLQVPSGGRPSASSRAAGHPAPSRAANPTPLKRDSVDELLEDR